MVVLDDADVEAAAEASLAASFLCAGQSCTAGERFLVHEAVHDDFVAAVGAAVARSVPPRRPVRRRHDDGAAQQRADRGEDGPTRRRRGRSEAPRRHRRRRAPGFPTDLYWEPTVLAGVDGGDGRRARGDVRSRRSHHAHLERRGALAIANASPYGLLSAVWTRDLARGLRFAEAVDAGWVNINESTNYWESHLPFGGRAGTSSGTGRVRRQLRARGLHRAEDRRHDPRRLESGRGRRDLLLPHLKRVRRAGRESRGRARRRCGIDAKVTPGGRASSTSSRTDARVLEARDRALPRGRRDRRSPRRLVVLVAPLPLAVSLLPGGLTLVRLAGRSAPVLPLPA
jgi:hypothetical protein